MPFPLLIPIVTTVASFAIPALVDYFTSDNDDEELIDDIEKQPDAFEDTIKLLESQMTTREIAQYYHIPQDDINLLRSKMSQISALMNKADVRSVEAETSKEKSIRGRDSQVVGAQKRHMQKAVSSFAKDERTAKKQKQQLIENYNTVSDDLQKLTDISSRPVSEANDLEAAKVATDLGVTISKQDVATKRVVEKDKAAQAQADLLKLNRMQQLNGD